MLSRLLRRLLLGQVLAGALLGWLIALQTDATSWLVVLMALLLLLPLATLLLVVMTTAIRSRAPGANALWWRSLLGEYGALVRVVLLQLPWAQAAAPPAPAATSRPQTPPPVPVVMVHGYLCNHRVWDSMAEQLRRAGHPVMLIDLEPLFTSIDRYAPLIEQAVTQLCCQTGAFKVALIGHSMGGLAIRAWLRAHGSHRVARIITLGTPHAGTKILHFTPTINGDQMRWRSAWLQNLATSESAATRSLMRIALTPQDHIVYPQRDQVLEGVPVMLFNGLGHLELCLHRAVIAWVLQQLEGLERHQSGPL